VGGASIACTLSRVALHLMRGMLTALCLFPFFDAAARDRRIQTWSAKLLAICGIRVERNPAAIDRFPAHALIVANHVSWLDIFVINTLQPCRFVAKSDIRSWPMLGWLSSKSGTIFIARGKVRDVRRIFEYLVATVRNGERVAFFPEGTTSAQGALLPFHANLFEAAIDAAVPIQPLAVRYLDTTGNLAPQADFIGDMSFVESLMVILKSGPLTAQLTLLPLIESSGTHRRELAAASQKSISAALGHSPGT
jgi:1-acyl-sn-glycerol-3-phosphate acyltransferase